MRIAYLGPAGTFTEDALGEARPGHRVRAAAHGDDPRRDPRGRARRGGPGPGPLRELDRGLGPQHPRHPRLRGRGGDDRRRARLRGAGPPDRREPSRAGAIEAVLSHPQPLAQCARFLREQLPGVERRSVSSTAAAVRMVGESDRPWAAIGARSAAELYGCVILREGIEDEADNVTRFVWIAPEGTEPPAGALEDLAGLLRAGRRPPRRPGRGAAGVLQPGRQPEPDRVAAAAPGPRPLHVLLRPGGAATDPARWRRRSPLFAPRRSRFACWAHIPVG